MVAACVCATPHLPGESTRCYACGRPSSAKMRVAEAHFGMVDGEHDSSLASEVVSPKATDDDKVQPKGLAMLLDAMTLMGARSIKVRAGWRLMLELRKALGVHQLLEWFNVGGIEYRFDSDLPERGVTIRHE